MALFSYNQETSLNTSSLHPVEKLHLSFTNVLLYNVLQIIHSNQFLWCVAQKFPLSSSNDLLQFLNSKNKKQKKTLLASPALMHSLPELIISKRPSSVAPYRGRLCLGCLRSESLFPYITHKLLVHQHCIQSAIFLKKLP